MSMTVLKLK